MTRSLSVLPLALFLAGSFPVLSLAEDMADECRKLAVEEEVAPEDMEDYIAECLAVVQSESAEEAADAMANLNEIAPEPGATPPADGAPPPEGASASKP